MARLHRFVCVSSLLLACSDSGKLGPDASLLEAGMLPDGLPPPDQADPPSADFTAKGCTLEDDGARCAGSAPLTVTFLPIVSSSVNEVEWDFGDGSDPSMEAFPTHEFLLPGSYDVSLTVSASTGMAQLIKPAFVVVEAVRTGDACDLDEQCFSQLCVCGEKSSGCEPPLDEGICTFDCSTGACALGDACVALDVAGGAEEWRGSLCLASCEEDADCTRPGFSCLDLPAREATAGWKRVCFPRLLSPVGGGCASASGEIDPTHCSGGACLPIGLLGLCSADCAERACPEATACASVGPEGMLYCLAECLDGVCEDDPLLACEAEDPTGEWGFSIGDPGGGDDASYCAAKRCSDAGACEPFGTCDAGFCRP